MWTYIMLKGTDTWDTGTFTFTGNTNNGNFTQVNIYNVTYTGTYTVSGVTVTLKNTEDYTGTLTDATHLSGTWQSNTIASDQGTWTAVKQ